MSALETATQRVLLGESMTSVAASHRVALLADMGFDPEDAPDDLFRKETMRFMNRLCRHFGDRHAGDKRLGEALSAWVRVVEEYDAFDALLTHFDFQARPNVLRRGRVLFPGPLTAHWDEPEPP